jgi:hypothetical protein
MKKNAKILSAATVALLVSWNGFAGVYSQGIYSAGTTYYGDHCIGSGNFQFGFVEYSYLTDASGTYLMDGHPRPGGTEHQLTRIYFGPTSVSVPMRPLPLFLIVGAVLTTVLGLGDIGWKVLRRRRYAALNEGR